MIRGVSSALFAIVCFLSVQTAGFASSEGVVQAQQVFEKTKAQTGTYSAYFWNRVTKSGSEPLEEWSAEFHSGRWQRVETPRHRLVADCSANTGFALDLLTGELIEGPQVAQAACGINSNTPLLGIEWVGPVDTGIEKADRIRVIDKEYVRQYDVTEDGILIGAVYTENRKGGLTLIVTDAVAVDRKISDASMFDRASLERSFVPTKYRVPPVDRRGPNKN